jgi:uncharacterized protein (TIGR03083 family)
MTAAHDSQLAQLTAVDSHAAWMALARTTDQDLADVFATVEDVDWGRRTPCTAWTVRDLAGHVLGAMRSAARLRETASQQIAVARRVKQTREAEVDALTATQIERTAALTPAQVVAEMHDLVDAAVRGRSRIPAQLRRRLGVRVHLGEINERWTLGYFLGCILTRDAWLHRIDLSDALGTEPTLSDHDRAIVGDVAAEWARRHGEPVRLTLTGTAGGKLDIGERGDEVVIDAIEFCRVVSGRATHDHPLLAQPVPF